MVGILVYSTYASGQAVTDEDNEGWAFDKSYQAYHNSDTNAINNALSEFEKFIGSSTDKTSRVYKLFDDHMNITTRKQVATEIENERAELFRTTLKDVRKMLEASSGKLSDADGEKLTNNLANETDERTFSKEVLLLSFEIGGAVGMIVRAFGGVRSLSKAIAAAFDKEFFNSIMNKFYSKNGKPGESNAESGEFDQDMSYEDMVSECPEARAEIFQWRTSCDNLKHFNDRVAQAERNNEKYIQDGKDMQKGAADRMQANGKDLTQKLKSESEVKTGKAAEDDVKKTDVGARESCSKFAFVLAAVMIVISTLQALLDSLYFNFDN